MNYTSLYIFILFSTVFFNKALYGQSAPNKQTASIWAPSRIKIDGKNNEWGDKLQAYNSSTDVYYTIANDDNNLYFIIKATDPAVIRYKIMSGGITLLIQEKDKKTDKGACGLSYPIFDVSSRPSFIFYKKQDAPSSPGAAAQYRDSIAAVNNNLLAATAKTIKTVGWAKIDTLISLYNDSGIRVSCKFDLQGAYLCEISLPLRLLGSQNIFQPTFNYHIIMNGGPSKFIATPARVTGGRDASGNPIPQAEIDAANEKLSAANLSRYVPTDFWGEYTLAKKP